MPKTFEELEALKNNWVMDPIWDIETTEGFEEHQKELFTFRHHMEELWANQAHARIVSKAQEMGIPNNLELVRYIMTLEKRLEKLEAKIGTMQPMSCI